MDFSPNLIYVSVLWRSGRGLLLGNFCQFLTVSACHMSLFSFPDDTLVSINGFLPNLVCALVLQRSGLGLQMGTFCQFLTVICPQHDCGRVISFHVFIIIWKTLP